MGCPHTISVHHRTTGSAFLSSDQITTAMHGMIDRITSIAGRQVMSCRPARHGEIMALQMRWMDRCTWYDRHVHDRTVFRNILHHGDHLSTHADSLSGFGRSDRLTAPWWGMMACMHAIAHHVGGIVEDCGQVEDPRPEFYLDAFAKGFPFRTSITSPMPQSA
jgi:hypothetical protein